jgi:hypothetical protein
LLVVPGEWWQDTSKSEAAGDTPERGWWWFHLFFSFVCGRCVLIMQGSLVMAVTRIVFFTECDLFTRLKNLPAIDNSIAKKKKKKNQYMFHTIIGRENRCRMNMNMIYVPKEGVSLTLDVLYGLHYPLLFLLRRSQLILVVLRTEDVGQQAYNSMVNAGRLVPVPPGAEGFA